MMNTDQSTDTAATPTVHAPQVGQTRRQRGAATTFKILDEKCGNRIEYLCVYENGDEAWYPLPIVDAISSYVSGPEERDVDVILRARIERAMAALPRPPWFDDYAARHILKAAEDTLAPEFTMHGEARPLLSTARLIAILDLVECYQLRCPGGAHRPLHTSKHSASYTFKSGDIGTAREALGKVEQLVKDSKPEREAADRALSDAGPESTTDEPGRVVSMTLDTTIPDRDTLALGYIVKRGVLGDSPTSIARDAYEYADAMIRNHATVPDDVKAIRFRSCQPGVKRKPEDMLHATPIDLDGLRRFFKREEQMAKYGQCLTSSSKDGKTSKDNVAPTRAKLDEPGAHLVFVEDLRTAMMALKAFGYIVLDGAVVREVHHPAVFKGDPAAGAEVEPATAAEVGRALMAHLEALTDLVSPVALLGECELQTVKRLVKERNADAATKPADSTGPTLVDEARMSRMFRDELMHAVKHGAGFVGGTDDLDTVRRLVRERSDKPTTTTAAPLTPSFEWAPLTGGERWCHAALNGITERAAIRPVHGGETWHARAFGQDLALDHPAVTTEARAMAWVEALLTAKLIELGMEREAEKLTKPASGATA